MIVNRPFICDFPCFPHFPKLPIPTAFLPQFNVASRTIHPILYTGNRSFRAARLCDPGGTLFVVRLDFPRTPETTRESGGRANKVSFVHMEILNYINLSDKTGIGLMEYSPRSRSLRAVEQRSPDCPVRREQDKVG